MYGCEAWTIRKVMKKQLETAEMWFLRRMMKISWVKKVTNEDVLRKAQTERQLMKLKVERQCSFLGHGTRKGGIEYQVVTGKVVGKRDRGRQRKTFLGGLGNCLDWRGVKIFRLAENRTSYLGATANVRIKGTIRRRRDQRPVLLQYGGRGLTLMCHTVQARWNKNDIGGLRRKVCDYGASRPRPLDRLKSFLWYKLHYSNDEQMTISNQGGTLSKSYQGFSS